MGKGCHSRSVCRNSAAAEIQSWKLPSGGALVFRRHEQVEGAELPPLRWGASRIPSDERCHRMAVAQGVQLFAACRQSV